MLAKNDWFCLRVIARWDAQTEMVFVKGGTGHRVSVFESLKIDSPNPKFES